MTIRARCISKHLLALAVAVLAAGCSQTHPQMDSSTNWLLSCVQSAECGGLSCLDGACNMTCDGNSACGMLDPSAECGTMSAQSEESVCILRCSDDADCRDGLACQGGVCADLAASESGPDPVAPDAGSPPASEELGFTQIAIGGRHGCGLVNDGSVRCWGIDAEDQQPDADVPSDFVALSAGGWHTCGLRADHSLFCWGGGMFDAGQVRGPNASDDRDFELVTSGAGHTCALHSGGSLQCWGADEYGQVSGPNAHDRPVAHVAAGVEHTCVIHTDETIRCWGRDLSGEVSGPNSVSSSGFVQVAAGSEHTCALRGDGSLACWGTAEWQGEVSGPNADDAQDYTEVIAAAYQTCGLHADGRVTCWGDDFDGQVSGANGSDATFRQVSGSIEVDGNNLCGLQADGVISCWGSDTHDQVSGVDAVQPPR